MIKCPRITYWNMNLSSNGRCVMFELTGHTAISDLSSM